MRKVKNIWYTEETIGNYGTGLILEMEDGTWMGQYSTDPIKTYSQIEKPLPTTDDNE